MTRTVSWLSGLSVLIVMAFLVAGCSQPTPAPVAPNAAANSQTAPAPVMGLTAASDEEHGHKNGAHGGIIVPIGRDSYHAEAVFEQNGTLRLYTLGSDESRIFEVDSQTLTAYVKPQGGAATQSIALNPEQQSGDAQGKTSQFIGQLPTELQGQAVEVTIPSLKIAGERFRLGFASASASHDAGMPSKVADDAEKKLYLTPGGIYTEEDIKANGNVTASEKFKGFMAKHDLKPKSGDKICPVTLTKANPKCSWIIAGKTYEFCCPPCVDEFVKQAKEEPASVKEPTDYVKQ